MRLSLPLLAWARACGLVAGVLACVDFQRLSTDVAPPVIGGTATTEGSSNPVPEPGSPGLLPVAMPALGWHSRQRRRPLADTPLH